jgi:DNA-binding MarR family transcriptional regulator
MEPTVDDYIGLLRQIRSLMEIQHAATMRNWEESRLQPGAGKLLAELSYCGEARISDLAGKRFVDTSVVSRQAAQLEKLGLIERRRAAGDARVALLRLTPDGEKVLDQWRQRQVKTIAAAVRGWDAADVAAASGYLDQLNNGLRAGLSG